MECVCVCVRAGACGGQKRVLVPLELELHGIVSRTIYDWQPNPGPLEEQQAL